MPNSQASCRKGTYIELGLTARTRIQGSSKNLRSCGGWFLLKGSITSGSQLFPKQLSASLSLSTFPPALTRILSSVLYNFSLPHGACSHSSCFLRIMDCHHSYCTSSPLSFRLHLQLLTTSFSLYCSIQSPEDFDCPNHLFIPGYVTGHWPT